MDINQNGLTHTCLSCGVTKPLDEFPVTKDINYRLNEFTGKRYKLNKCKACMRAYNNERKAAQRERERLAKEKAQEIGSNLVIVPINDRTPIKAIEDQRLLVIEGEVYRLVKDRKRK